MNNNKDVKHFDFIEHVCSNGDLVKNITESAPRQHAHTDKNAPQQSGIGLA
jgi:hypothetical protein